MSEQMANVQIDSGEFTRIANVLLEKTAQLHLNGTQYSIILTVWRFTYGFQRCEHELSITFISKATGLTPRLIRRELKNLIDRNVLLVSKESTKSDSRVLKFNKDYDTWIEGTKKTSEDELDLSQGTKKTSQQGTKKTPKKETKENSKETIDTFFESIWILYPKKEGKGQVSKGQKEKLFKIGIEEMTRAINRHSKAKSDTDKKYWKNGSTFFKSGYVDYLDANYKDEIPKREGTVAW